MLPIRHICDRNSLELGNACAAKGDSSTCVFGSGLAAEAPAFGKFWWDPPFSFLFGGYDAKSLIDSTGCCPNRLTAL
jgi:hypothetical protein